MENRRAHPRIAESLRVSLTIESAPDAPEIVGRVYECLTSDISLRGARLVSDLSLPDDARFQLAVVLAGDEQVYRHLGRVVWCRTRPAGGAQNLDQHYIGIEFNLSPGPQFDTWRTAILRMFERGLGHI
jgi:hypothetical protein